MATITNNRSNLMTDPLRNFRFLVTFTAQTNPSTAVTNLASTTAVMGFTSVSGMAVTTDSIPYREGGYNTTVHQIPGQTTFAPITLQRGLILGTSKNWAWMRNMFATVQGGAGSRGVAENFRCDLDIAVLSHPIPGIGFGVRSLARARSPARSPGYLSARRKSTAHAQASEHGSFPPKLTARACVRRSRRSE